MNDIPERTGVLVVGGGIAGLGTALMLAGKGHRVTVVARTRLTATASFLAQGGIAAVLSPEDTIESHAADTRRAGGDLCHPDAVDAVVEAGPEAVRWLESLGVEFSRTRDGGELDLAREGGHGLRRVAHAADATGREIMTVLATRAAEHPRIEVLDNHTVTDLITSAAPGQSVSCMGALILDRNAREPKPLRATAVVLATGGASGLYLHTTNPDAGSGDGIAMAWRAGCRVANMEFVQFHPTSLYRDEGGPFLISEALRGEGAVLRLPDGSEFMKRYDSRAELAPRDIVARAIHSEMTERGIDHVYLDISHLPAETIRARFPVINAVCLKVGIDMTAEPIPVVPAAHYTCGGIVADLDGRTDLPGLYAVGECAFTGLHGANRLASNSLLEALAFAFRASMDIDRTTIPRLAAPDRSAGPRVVPGVREPVETPPSIGRLTQRLKRVMSNDVGIVRSNWGLMHAAQQLELIATEAETICCDPPSPACIDLRNQLIVGRLITESALRRRESRGLHFNRDYPGTLPFAEDTILIPPVRAGTNVADPGGSTARRVAGRNA